MSSSPDLTDSASPVWVGHTKGSAGYQRVLIALFCAGIATFAQLYSVQGLLPMLARGLDITAAQAALTISAATVGLAVAVLPWSFAADRFGRVRVMGAAIIAATCFGLVVPLSPDFPVLLGLRIAEGMALGAIPAVALAYLNEEVHPLYAARAAGVYVAGTTIGGLSGRVLAVPIAELAGWRIGTLTISVLAAVAAVAFLVLAPRSRGFVPNEQGGISRVFRGMTAAVRNPHLGILYAQGFLLAGSFVSVYNYLGFRLEAAPYLLPPTAAGLIFLAYLSGTFSSRRAAVLAERAGRRTILLGSIAIMAGGVLLTLLSPLPVVLLGLVAMTTGFFAAHSIASGWTGSITPSGKAQASSLYNLAYYTGSSVLGWASGLVFQSVGWAVMAITLVVLVAISGAIALAMPTATRVQETSMAGHSS